MTYTKTFLGWDEPCLEKAAQFLIEKYSNDSNFIDMSTTLVILPGKRSGRRLQELLTFFADKADLALIPPAFTTIGSLLEIFFVHEQKIAPKMTKLLSWVKALLTFEKEELRPILPFPPKDDDISGWLTVAELYNKIYQELSAAGLSYQSVVNKLNGYDGYNDDERWSVLEKVCLRYIDILKQHDLVDEYTLQGEYQKLQPLTPSPYQELFLVAVTDLNTVTKELLKALPIPINILIHAPQSLAAGFDDFGSIKQEYWENYPIQISDQKIIITDKPADQAKIITELLTDVSPEDATIGVINPEIEPYIIQTLRQKKMPANTVSGVAIISTPPVAFLKSCKEYLQKNRFNELSNLIRHLDIQLFLSANDTSESYLDLTALDNYQASHLQGFLSNKLPDSTDKDHAATSAQREKIDQLLAPFKKDHLLLAEWCPLIAHLIIDVFGSTSFDQSLPEDSIIIHVCTAIKDTLDQCSFAPKDLLKPISGANAIDIVLRFLESMTIPIEGDTTDLEILRWLEILLDDAPFLILSGFNEVFIPESLNADPFLPNTLRQLLGLTDNKKRYARDAYTLSAALSNREVYFIVGKHSANNEPYMPSRLLFATDNLTIAKRTARFYSDTPTLPSQTDFTPTQNDSQLWAPQPPQATNIVLPDTLSVSAFKSYLTCPYRFYLTHILHLKTLEDRFSELDPANIGTILHRIMQIFAMSSAANSTDEKEIEEKLLSIFNDYCQKNFATSPLPAVQVQLELLKARLAPFARLQAAQAKDGWQIKYFEKDLEAELDLADGSSIRIKARIDRIDHKPQDNTWRILDYKAGDSAKKPESTFRTRAQEWSDLQLPLYKYIVEKNNICQNPQLGYISLPAKLEEIGFDILDPNKVDLDSGVQEAREIVKKIKAFEFWPPSEKVNPLYDPFADLCNGF
ncbi:MAG: PD-(D/E)XK nuclease family protein [Bdellovibrionota bacterium]|jgi:ATP-dependent helicase/nuclease subunit B